MEHGMTISRSYSCQAVNSLCETIKAFKLKYYIPEYLLLCTMYHFIEMLIELIEMLVWANILADLYIALSECLARIADSGPFLFRAR